MIRNRLDPTALRNSFLKNGKYNPKQTHLIDILSKFITTIVQYDACMLNLRRGNTVGDSLHSIMCQASLSYVPIPIADKLQMKEKGDLVNNKTPLGQGVNARVYSSVFKNNPIVTKAPTSFDPKAIVEVFVNMVIINTLVMNNVLSTILVPTYGLFICPSNVPENGSSLKNSKELQICNKGTNDKPSIFMVQEKITGITYTKALYQKKITHSQFKKHVGDLFTALIIMEKSPYRLSHNDFHSDNVMLRDNGSVVILDFGFASFVDKEHSYVPFTYDLYIGNNKPHIFTGASDFFDFIKSVILLTRNSDPSTDNGKIYVSCIKLMELFSREFKNYDMSLCSSFMNYRSTIGDSLFYLFDILEHIEKDKRCKNKQLLHLDHISTLSKLKHEYIAKNILNNIVLLDWSYIQTMVHKTNESGLFEIPIKMENVIPMKSTLPVNTIPVIMPVLPNPVKVQVKHIAVQKPNPVKVQAQPIPNRLGLVCGPIHGLNSLKKEELMELAKQRNINPNQPLHVLCRELGIPVIGNKHITARRVHKKTSCTCKAIIQSGKHKNKRCNRPCIKGNRCGIHMK